MLCWAPPVAAPPSRRDVSLPCRARERGPSRIARREAEFLFDAKQLVVLRDPIAAAGRTGLDHPAVAGDGEVRDERVLRLARSRVLCSPSRTYLPSLKNSLAAQSRASTRSLPSL